MYVETPDGLVLGEEEMAIRGFACRDIGYGVEEGTVCLPAISEPDWTGKSAYVTTDGDTVYLFDDELR